MQTSEGPNPVDVFNNLCQLRQIMQKNSCIISIQRAWIAKECPPFKITMIPQRIDQEAQKINMVDFQSYSKKLQYPQLKPVYLQKNKGYYKSHAKFLKYFLYHDTQSHLLF